MWKYGVVLVFINCLILSISYPSKHSHFSLSRGKILLDSQASFATLFVRRAVYGLFLHLSTPNAFGPLLQMLNFGLISENTVAGTHWDFFLFSYSVVLGLWWPQRKAVWQLLWRMALLLPISKIFTWNGQLVCKALQCHTNILPVSRSQSIFSIGKRSCPLL